MFDLMELIQLKVPPDQVALIADAIERDIKANPGMPRNQELTKVQTWLRYRLARWLDRSDPTDGH